MTATIATGDTIRAAMYARVSTTDQNLARQYEANLDAATRAGWTVTEYEDPGLSASRFAGRKGGANREDWSRLLADLAAGLIDVLVLWEPSRGDRHLTTWSALLDACRRTGTLIHVTSHGRTYDPAQARDWRSLAEDGVDSAYESERLSMRIKAGKEYWASQGHPVSGAAPYGVHRVNDPDKTRNRWVRDEPDPQTGPVAARIIRDVAAGVGYKALGRALDTEQVATPGKSASWDHRTIVKIAAHPVTAAVLVDAGMVDEATALKARERVARTKGTGRGKAERPSAQVYRYSSCLACETCGQPVRGTVKGGGTMYRCAAGHVSIPVGQVDAYVDWLAINRLARPSLVGLFRQGDNRAADEARTEAARLQAELDEWVRAGISARAYAIKEADLLPKIAAAEQRAREAETPPALAGLPDTDLDVVAARWEALTVSARKAALRAIAPRAILRHGKRGTGRTPVEERVVLWPDED
jgi:site-specific DNA recombinase